MRFVLVHGGMHAAWCWSFLAPLLEDRGHVVVAPDLPGHGARREEPASLDGYAASILDVVAPDDVVIGHSLGGVVLSVVADRIAHPIGHLVFLASAIPEGDGASVLGARRASGAASTLVEDVVDGQRCLTLPEPVAAAEYLFHDVDTARADWAIGQLRPQPIAPLETAIHLRPRWWERHPRRSYIACDDDRTLDANGARDHARRIDARLWTLPSSHSPFLSMPERLAELLDQVVG